VEIPHVGMEPVTLHHVRVNFLTLTPVWRSGRPKAGALPAGDGATITRVVHPQHEPCKHPGGGTSVKQNCVRGIKHEALTAGSHNSPHVTVMADADLKGCCRRCLSAHQRISE
jgi:hypothetical protein